jgi:hypothetical protein
VSLDVEPGVVEERLREASRLAGSLRIADRLSAKIDLTDAAVTARLREASDLLQLCLALAEAGRGFR